MAGHQVYGPDSIGDLTKLNSTTVQLAASTITLAGLQYDTAALQCDTLTTGPGSLDTGSVQDFKTYNVFAILDSGDVALIASLSSSPSGYNVYTQVGNFKTVGSGAVNGTSANENGSVGDTKHSTLSESEFVTQNGGGWVLADGRNVSGSAYATLTGSPTIPDARGQFLRGKNNGRSDGNEDPGGERGLGSFQADENKAHTHSITLDRGGSDGGANPYQTTGNKQANSSPGSANTSSAGGESRPKNIAVNIFIKIN